MQITQTSQVHPGMTVYRANIARNSSWVSVQRFHILSHPYIKTGNGHFVDTTQEYITLAWYHTKMSSLTYDPARGGWCEPKTQYMSSGIETWSLRDAGVEQKTPRYNDHALFDDLFEAMQYIEAMINGMPWNTASGTFNVSETNEEDTIQEESLDDAYERAMRGI